MNEFDGGGGPHGGNDASQILERLKTIAITSAATIVAIHGTALAAAERTAAPERTVIDGPLLDLGTVAASGVALATLGAYRLMRARNRKRLPDDPGSNP